MPAATSAVLSPVAGYREEHPPVPAFDEVARGSFYYGTAGNPGTGCYVAASLEAALRAFSRSSTFEEGCLMAVNPGEDADTTGAIYGVSAIPADWLSCLAKRDLIEFYHASELSFSPTIPATIRRRQRRRRALRDSSKSTSPAMTVPTAPIPVQTA